MQVNLHFCQLLYEATLLCWCVALGSYWPPNLGEGGEEGREGEEREGRRDE